MRSDAELRDLFEPIAPLLADKAARAIIGTLGIHDGPKRASMPASTFEKAAVLLMVFVVPTYLQAHSLYLEEDELQRGARLLFRALYRSIRELQIGDEGIRNSLHSAAKQAAQVWTAGR